MLMAYQDRLIFVSNSISSVCITFITFVHWRKGPACWRKVSYPLFRFALTLCFVILPLLNIVISTVLVCDKNVKLMEHPKSTWVIFNYALFLHRILDYYLVVRKGILDDARY
jgi:hypothetical protein